MPHLSRLMDSEIVYCTDEKAREELETLRDQVRKKPAEPFGEADWRKAEKEMKEARYADANAFAAAYSVHTDEAGGRIKERKLTACGKEYRILSLLGHGKGGYSYLAETDSRQDVVLKQIHHEPCDYYTFGNKIEAEKRDYERLLNAGIRIPALIAVDEKAEIVVKEYIAGDTIFDLVRDGCPADPYLPQIREMAARAKAAGLNIDYFPTNFVIRDGLIWYVDYECNDYMEKWNFENWGIRYWSRTPEFLEYLKQHEERTNGENT